MLFFNSSEEENREAKIELDSSIDGPAVEGSRVIYEEIANPPSDINCEYCPAYATKSEALKANHHEYEDMKVCDHNVASDKASSHHDLHFEYN